MHVNELTEILDVHWPSQRNCTLVYLWAKSFKRHEKAQLVTEFLIKEKEHVPAHQVIFSVEACESGTTLIALLLLLSSTSFAACLTKGLFAVLPLSTWLLKLFKHCSVRCCVNPKPDSLTPPTSSSPLVLGFSGMNLDECLGFAVQHIPVWPARPSLSVDICVDLVATVSRLRDQWLRANQLL